MRHIGLEVELVAPVPTAREEALILRIDCRETREEPLVHLVRRPCDARADRGGDPIAPRPDLLHRGDRRIGDAGQRPLPPGMRRADYARLRVREQHRRAIRGQDAEQQSRAFGDERVGMRALGIGISGVDAHHVRRMNLIQRCERRTGQHRRRRPPPILRDRCGIVLRSQPDVQARDHPLRHAAAPPEKTVRHIAQPARADHLDVAHRPNRIR